MTSSDHVSWDRIPLIISFPDTAKFSETYGFAGSTGAVNLEGQLFRPRARRSGSVYIFMHPSSTLQLLPMPKALADAGMHVLCAASRYPKNDSALIMEKVLIDLGAWMRHAREQLGYEKVVLVGWSGGGALSLFYQAQAEQPSLTHTPAGDEVDIVSACLAPADGIIFIAAHLSRAETLTEWLDPSVTDELNPDERDREYDIYAPDSPHKPPFSPDFVTAFRAAQISRNRRITAWCQDMLESLRRQGSSEVERAFVVHRTMCDVRWIDPQVDPNGRKPNHCHIGDPRTANVGPTGLARYTSLRSWLSQWSYDLSNAKGPANAARISQIPVLQIENAADDAVPATHGRAINRALATPRKQFVRIEGATHYYLNQPQHLASCVATVADWSRKNGVLEE
jgi:pimeloyl-ACP methyl ester carboxylesterase